MVIQEADFKLTPTDETSIIFDLELLYKVQPKNKEARLEFKDAGYGLTLSTAIKKIAAYRVHCKHKNEAVRLVTYFKDYKKELEDLTELIKNTVS